MAKQDAGVGPMTANQAIEIAEAYLCAVRDIRSTQANSPETSYYPALANLFNAVGKTLKPKVLCVMNLKDQGADNPDGGLFTADQFGRNSQAAVRGGLVPSRGAIEAKSAKVDVKVVAASEQVAKYLRLYGIVIVTNLRDFLIVERGANAHPVTRESFSLADSESDFWQDKVAHPRATAQRKGRQFIEFIKRACLHNAPLVNPKDVAWFLASYAKDALARVEDQKHLPALQAIRSALEDALGMKFTEERGEHFFRSTLVQTLFYGVFSAWVLWHRENPARNGQFDWQKTEWSLHVPFIRTLYEEVAKPSCLGPLRLVEVLDWAGHVLNRVEPNEFFRRFADEHAVQYFYEPFLEAYDPELRKQLGVWYTPPEIVRFQVARVDQVLREELGVLNGLADPNVIVLDPCCGTGAYLVEVLKTIERTNRDLYGDALVPYDVKSAATARVFGFEILPAPFVVAHLQIGLLLQSIDLPLAALKGERVGVYLTNALTGWEPPTGAKATLPLPYPELEEERDAAEHLKRDKEILVVLGNPPYNGFAGVAVAEEARLIEPYKAGLEDWGITKNYLDNLYVRFLRLAERRIAEMTGKGVVSFISMDSWLTDPSFVLLRKHLLSTFDRFWVEHLHGDRENSEYGPDGGTSESIFAIKGYSPGITRAVVTSLWVKTGKRARPAEVLYRDDANASRAAVRRGQLLGILEDEQRNSGYVLANPSADNRYSFAPVATAKGYGSWPPVIALAAQEPLLGLNENRKQSLYSCERHAIIERMKAYFDSTVSTEGLRSIHPGLVAQAANYDPSGVRARLLKTSGFKEENVVRFVTLPFDLRWAYIERQAGLWNRVRPDLLASSRISDRFLLTRRHAPKAPDGGAFYAARHLTDQHVMHKDAYSIPFTIPDPEADKMSLFINEGGRHGKANLSENARSYFRELGIEDPNTDTRIAAFVWMHALAIGYSPAYLGENADGIRRGWPHIPLPHTREALEASAALGEQIAGLLDIEADMPGVTTGTSGSLFRAVCVPSKVDGRGLDPNVGDFAVTAGWGHAGKGGVVMPGKGRLSQRAYDAKELKAIEAEARARGMTAKTLIELLGEKTCDVYLNDAAYWCNIPSNVWEYCIGGYQVIKKWLSYREQSILGRAITPEEAREVTNMARRITALILMQPELDSNYEAVKADTWPWPHEEPPME